MMTYFQDKSAEDRASSEQLNNNVQRILVHTKHHDKKGTRHEHLQKPHQKLNQHKKHQYHLKNTL